MSPGIRTAESADPQSFERIYQENSGRVYALCMRMTGDPARAGELTQDVFVRAWKKLGSRLAFSASQADPSRPGADDEVGGRAPVKRAELGPGEGTE